MMTTGVRVASPVNAKDFYLFVATTIPVLYVAFAFQERASGGFLPDDIFTSMGVEKSPRLDALRAFYTLSLVFSIVLGEVTAIVGLVEPFHFSFRPGYLAWFALIFLIIAGIGVTAPAVITNVTKIDVSQFPSTVRPIVRMRRVFGATVGFYIAIILWIVLIIPAFFH
jgi:hypothetical protein